MGSRRRRRIAALAAAPFVLLAGGCEVAAEPEPHIPRLEGVSGIDVPADATVEEHSSSERDFHGGGDEVYVFDIPADSRRSPWDPAEYAEGLPADGDPTALDVARSAGAPIAADVQEELSCREPIREGQDYVLICYHDPRGEFFVVVRIF